MTNAIAVPSEPRFSSKSRLIASAVAGLFLASGLSFGAGVSPAQAETTTIVKGGYSSNIIKCGTSYKKSRTAAIKQGYKVHTISKCTKRSTSIGMKYVYVYAKTK